MPSPRKIKPLSRHPVAHRVAGYINQTFAGNMTAAAAALAIDYDQLWRLATGRFKRPDSDCLLALARHSGRSMDWWCTGKDHVVVS